MMHRLLLAAGLASALVALPAHAVTCTANNAAATPDADFTDNGDGTVTHAKTGLMWKQCVEGMSTTTTACDTGSATSMDWATALNAASAVFANNSDWRLPTQRELLSIVETCRANPAINDTLFPNDPAGWTWSDTTYSASPTNAWFVLFGDGGSVNGGKTFNKYVRLVRGGQSFGSFDSKTGYTPSAYSFTAAANAALNTAVESDVVTLAGLSTVTGIKVSGGQYAVSTDGGANWGAYTAAPGAVGNGNQIKVRVTSSASNHTAVSATLTVGGVDGVFSATTLGPPAYQSAALNAGLTVAALTFDKTLVNNLADLPTLKAAVTFAGDGTTFNALAAGDAVALSGATLTVTFANALSGNTNKIQIAANSLKDSAGNVLASAVTTAALDAVDTAPAAFSFSAATGAALSTATESSAITVTGINAPAAISISGGEYAVSSNGGGSWGTYTANAGTVNLDDQVKVKLTSSSSYSTAATATLTIGGVDATFSVTTLGAPYIPPPQPTVINAPANVETTLVGTTPVTAEAGSILAVPAGLGAAGTLVTLPAPTASGEAVTIKLNGKVLSVTPLDGKAALTLKKITLNGVETLVLVVTGGSVSVSAQAGQPLLAINGSVVLTAGDNGGAVSARTDGDTGSTVAVTSGYIVLPGNAFAAVQDGKLYAGEVAVLDAGGKVARVRLGSLAGSGSLGDPLKVAAPAGVAVSASTPDLRGKAARISGQNDFTAALAAALGKDVSVQGQNADGVLSLGFPGGKLQALPYGDITIDTSRPDGVTLTVLGKAEVATGGVITRLAPAVDDFAQFAASLAKLDKNAIVSVLEDGMLHVRLGGVTYPLQPAWNVTQDQAGQAGLSMDGQGMIVYRDNAGNRQTLYPVFADLPRLIAVFRALDANATVASNGDGTSSAKFQGKTFTLKPDYRLIAAPLDQAGKDWWLEQDGSLFIRNTDGSAQGFAVQ